MHKGRLSGIESPQLREEGIWQRKKLDSDTSRYMHVIHNQKIYYILLVLHHGNYQAAKLPS